MKHYTKQYIDGQWREGSGGEMSNDNPFTGKSIYTYRAATKKDLDDAYAAAVKAQPEWAATTPIHKHQMLEKLIPVIHSMEKDIFECLCEEVGATTFSCKHQFHATQEVIWDALRYPLMMDGKIMPSNIPGRENYVTRVPKGVICVIAPWNVPLLLAMRSVIPAIATGNSVVVKPATDSPGSAFLIAEMFERAGFPPGLYNAIAGRGSEIGDAMVEHPSAALISFTGSTAVGRRIGKMAGGMLKDVSLELGGNNVMLVLEDADIEPAARAAVHGAFFHQGQVCMGLNRIITVGNTHDRFVEAFVAATKERKVGNPADPQTFIGPVINKAQADSVEGYVKATIAAGAKVALEGKRENNLIYPWIFTEVKNDMPASCNEVFGPVCCVIRAKTEDEAIDIANDTEYGLSSCLFTKDLYRGMQLARRVKTGMLHINDQSIADEHHIMFGGVKASGIGRFNAQWVVDKFTVDKWLSVQTKYRF